MEDGTRVTISRVVSKTLFNTQAREERSGEEKEDKTRRRGQKNERGEGRPIRRGGHMRDDKSRRERTDRSKAKATMRRRGRGERKKKRKKKREIGKAIKKLLLSRWSN